MRQPGPELRARAALLVAAGLLLTGCSAGVAASSAPSPAGLTAVGSPAGDPAASPAPPAPAAAVRQITLTVSGGKVTGDTGLVRLRVGEPARVTVTSDVDDEVHVHSQGAGFGKDVAAGGTVTIEFVETAPGRFEVELEKAKRTLTRLQVS